MKCNASQTQAIEHEGGPLLIVAGAGTGKTTVLTERIKHLIQEKKVDPYHIFITTFTEKASGELEARLDEVMPFGYRQPWLGTFHSICERILRLEGLEIGLNPNFSIMTVTNQWLFLREHLFDFDLDYYRPLGNPTKFISSLISFFSRINDEDIHPDNFLEVINAEEDHTEAKRLLELHNAHSKYQVLKADNKKVDFGDLITLTLKLFRTRPNVLKRYQQQFEHMLVDEFQDTNIAQFELIKLLAPPASNPNLVVVGDDNQSIYKFRGASLSNILQFKEMYPEADSIILNDNYRSTQKILDGSYQSIQNNNPDTLETKLNISKKLISHHPAATEPKVLAFETGVDEVSWTIQEIVRLVTEEGLAHKDIAILARSNSHLEPYMNFLKLAGIPYQRLSNSGLYDQTEISFLINLLKVVANPHDSMELFGLAEDPRWKLDSELLLDKISEAKSSTTSLWDKLRGEPNAELFVQTIGDLRHQATTVPITNLLQTFIEEHHYLDEWISEDSVESQLKIKNINLFFNQLKSFELSTNNPNLIQFLDVFEDWQEAGENPGQAQLEDVDAVSLMTIHGSKGLEFGAVFVCSLLAGRFPGNDRKDKILIPDGLVKEIVTAGDEHLQEERRLFYVAMTRAKQFLYLTYAVDMGGAKKWKPSGFLTETGLTITTMSSNPTTRSNETQPQSTHTNHKKVLITKVSHSELDTFSACPLRYKYKFLLKIPTREGSAASYGNTIHKTLQTLHQYEMQNQPLSREQIEQEYRTNFTDVGFTDVALRDARFDRGLLALGKYYTAKEGLFGKPHLLEQKFSIKLETVTLTGKIDRIDRMSDGSFGILDYKTGDPKEQEKVDKDEQLSIYALAAREVFGLNVSLLGLYYFDHNTLVSTTRSDKQIEKMKQKIEKKVEDMQASDFPAKPDAVKCGWCEFNSLCPFAKKK